MAILSRIQLRRIGDIIRFRRGLGNVEPGDFGVYCRGTQRTDRLVRLRFFACATLASLACCAAADAQTGPAEDVTVNPSAASPRQPLYPRYGGAPRPLLQP